MIAYNYVKAITFVEQNTYDHSFMKIHRIPRRVYEGGNLKSQGMAENFYDFFALRELIEKEII